MTPVTARNTAISDNRGPGQKVTKTLRRIIACSPPCIPLCFLHLLIQANMSQFPEEPLNLPASEGFGYYPAYPGLKVKDGRYEVIRKLGYGPRSSVWLALDLKCVCCKISCQLF